MSHACAAGWPQGVKLTGWRRAQVLDEGALQPVIGLLSSSCTESKRESALLLGQFATTEPDYKAKIVQRGAVPAAHRDAGLLGRAAQGDGRLRARPPRAERRQPGRHRPGALCLRAHRWRRADASTHAVRDRAASPPAVRHACGTQGALLCSDCCEGDTEDKGRAEHARLPPARAQAGGLPPLLELMASRNGNLQHNAAFALYGLADNEDNIAAIVRDGGVQCLQDCELLVQVGGGGGRWTLVHHALRGQPGWCRGPPKHDIIVHSSTSRWRACPMGLLP